MIYRPKFPKNKDVLIINDVPIKSEIIEGEKFSSVSNLGLLTALRTGRVNAYNKIPVEGYEGITGVDVHTTYLDYTYYGEEEVEGNFDYKNEIRKRKELKEVKIDEIPYLIEKDCENLVPTYVINHQFHRLELFKDVFISDRLYNCLVGVIDEIKTVQPKIIVITGKWSLLFLTGCTTVAQTMGNHKDRKPLGGLTTYRSSIMALHESWGIGFDCLAIPIYHPMHAMGMPDKIPIMELDIQKIGFMYKKVKQEGIEYYKRPDKTSYVGVDKKQILSGLSEILSTIEEKPSLVSIDIETMFSSIIDCIGLTTSINEGLCIPFASANNPNLWSLEDEVEIMVALKEVLEHKNCQHVGQNYSYEQSFYHKLWCIDVDATYDSMIIHHVLYNYLPKDLAFLASLYSEHYCYWKDELSATKESPETRWVYNTKDVMYTLEVTENLLDILATQDDKLQDFYSFQQNEVAPLLMEMMNSGVKIDKEHKEELYKFFSGLMEDIKNSINDCLGFEFNINSTPQKRKVFSDFLGIKLNTNKKTGKESCDAASMLGYIENYPLYKPFLTLLLEYASIKVFTTTFLGMELDEDDRARTQYRIAKTATYRLASTKNVWGRGANFQNIPEKGKINLKYALQVIEDNEEVVEVSDNLYNDVVAEGSIILPNVKKMFLPDEGKEIADADFSGADAMIVAWESECKWLIDFFKSDKGKLYAYIASEHLQREITSDSPEYKDYKAVCHGTNYGVGIPKIASMLGITISSAKQLQDFYLDLCPEIVLWHNRIQKEISRKGYLTNIFGARGWFLNRNDPYLYNKAYAFIPQSSIGILVNKGATTVRKNYPDIKISLQVHDSLVAQYPIILARECRRDILNSMIVSLPYQEPLVIPADMKVSTVSYGDTRKIKDMRRDYNLTQTRLLEIT